MERCLPKSICTDQYLPDTSPISSFNNTNACAEITLLNQHFNFGLPIFFFLDFSKTCQVRTRRGGGKRLKMSHSTTLWLDLYNKSQATIFSRATHGLFAVPSLAGCQSPSSSHATRCFHPTAIGRDKVYKCRNSSA